MTYKPKLDASDPIHNYFADLGKRGSKGKGNHGHRIPDSELTDRQRKRRQYEIDRKAQKQAA